MPHRPPTTARLEAFSDGVIAVIITIMVLELKVPHQNGAGGLYALVPILLIYLLSFTFTGIYWINHQHLLRRIEEGETLVLYANLFFLFCLSMLPFATSYVIEKGIDSFAVSLYAVSMLVTGFSFLLLRLAVHRNLENSGDLKREDKEARGRHIRSLALYLLAIPLAYVRPMFALVVVGVVTVIWIIPNLSFRRQG